MNAAPSLADYYASLIERCNRDPSGRPRNLPKHDQTIFYVISTRYEIDMNGFDSVFDQLLTEDELLFLSETLRELGASQLAGYFELAHTRLKNAGFFEDESLMVSDLETDADRGFLDEIDDALRKNEALWDLDDELVKLIPPNTDSRTRKI